jgi:hypothetical protein
MKVTDVTNTTFATDTFNTSSNWANYDHNKILGTERY